MIMIPTDSYKIRFKAASKDIIILNSIIDSYESLALIRTDDKEYNNCILMTTGGMLSTLQELLESLQSEGLKIENLQITKSDNIDFD